jgi:2-(1,2-epoxy-1,2-dihydrophenyl)acetyl-CoA isomerase
MVDLAYDGAVATLSLNRPDKLNAVSLQMNKEIRNAVRTVAKEGKARALVLTGAGRGFCVGQDLSEFSGAKGLRVDDHVRATYNTLVMQLQELEMPVIGAINGVAAGAGAGIALACDLRVMGEGASLIQAFIRVGLIPDTGSTWFLAQLVGPARAFELAATGRAVGAEEALQIGLANRVVSDDAVLSSAQEWAAELAAMPTRALALTKRAIRRATTVSLEDALEHEAQLQQVAVGTHDHGEGVASFLEKRDPVFTGS